MSIVIKNHNFCGGKKRGKKRNNIQFISFHLNLLLIILINSTSTCTILEFIFIDINRNGLLNIPINNLFINSYNNNNSKKSVR